MNQKTSKQNLDIAIVGAGIMGLSAAYALQKFGAHITLYDPKGFPAQNASFVAGGMLAPYAEIEHMNMRWVEAGLASIDIWKKILPTLPGDTDFAQNGSLLVAHPQDRYILERFAAHLPENQRCYQNAKDLEPALDNRFSQGLFLEGEAHIHPARTMQALIKALQNNIIFKQEAANPQDLLASYDTVIDCRGMGTQNDDPDLRSVKGELAIVHNPEFSLSRPVRLMHPRYPLYIVPRQGNIFMIGATIIESEGEGVSLRSGMELMSALSSLHPSFADAKIIEITSGVRPSYPDNLPRIRRHKNLISCNGLFRHGFLLSPIMAEIIGCEIEGKKHSKRDLFLPAPQDNNQKRSAA
ncbi:MAG: FAD-dependent oxidoreductase [Alphaproteobacteria bacterium]|nr:FAD-dependent oxidoreductase [Alphaproteobacteria bacterium]